jgi:alpha-ketoglutaric semialdehyde dehydrogenase
MPEKKHPDASPHEVDEAMESAWSCFPSFRKQPGKERARLLRSIARHLEESKDKLVSVADFETSLGHDRLQFELKRTISELELFANLAESEKWKEVKEEQPEPNRKPIPKPGMQTVNVPIGPVVVVGACNFPFAISVVGTDTASALAVGCPVVVKAHPDHARTCQSLASLVKQALVETEMPKSAFQLVHGIEHAVTRTLIEHRRTSCVAFTGSLKGGRVLHELACQRPTPIPFHAEMGSLNPVVILPHALEQSGTELAKGYIAAVNLFAGQMCTKPGALLVTEGPCLDQFIDEIRAAVRKSERMPMLNRTVFENFEAINRDLESALPLLASNRPASPELENHAYCQVFQVSGNDFMNNREFRTEAFGPTSLLVRCQDKDELLGIARSLEGSLTGTIHAHQEDLDVGRKLMPIIESRVGRFLWGGFPPGVTPGMATHHGGPWPATTDSRHTSIGLFAYRRFVRPVCRQGFPENI